MSVVRSLWASVQGDPVFMRRVNGWFTVFWVVMIPVSIVTGWISSVTYVAALSLWALGVWALVGLAGGAGRGRAGQARTEEGRRRSPGRDRRSDGLGHRPAAGHGMTTHLSPDRRRLRSATSHVEPDGRTIREAPNLHEVAHLVGDPYAEPTGLVRGGPERARSSVHRCGRYLAPR